MKNITFYAIMLILAVTTSSLNAQGWQKSLATDLTLTQSAYSDSWKGGEAGNASWIWNATGHFERAFSPKFQFRNNSRLSFGQTYSQNKETKKWSKPSKSSDLIDIENLGLFTLDAYVDPYIGFRIETQFMDASVPGFNRYFTPLKLTESAGIAKEIYKTKQNDLLTRLGLALRQIITQDTVSTNPNRSKTNTTNDGGIESVTDFTFVLAQNLQYYSKLSLYKALFYSKADELKGLPNADDWKQIDVNWENQVSATIVKYATVSLYMQLLYDKEVDHKGRFKQTLALGLTYNLF